MKVKIAYLIALYVALIFLYTVVPTGLNLVRQAMSWLLLGLMAYIGVLLIKALTGAHREEDAETDVAE